MWKPPSLTKVEYKKKPDYADTAYRDAVSRLRILLAESYVPIRRPLRELDSAGEETDNQSVISGGSRTSRIGRSRYHSPLTQTRSGIIRNYRSDPHSKWDTGCHTAPPELMSFIERQEEYIEQLERESRFCRDELSSMLGKVKEVISENENLHEKQKSNLLKSVFDHLETETETETDLDIAKNIKSPKHVLKHRPLEGPTIVFESRISELEAQLTQTKIDLKKAQDENETFKRKVSDGMYGEGLDSCKKQVENLQREKAVLQDTVSKLQSALTILRDKENNTCDQVKRSLDVAEQAQYEKTAAEHEIRRLKDELERQHGKLRDAINEQSRRIADERSAVERRYSQQIEQLTAELGIQWEQTNKLQLELDKQRRENGDLRRELAQKQAHIDDLKKDMNSKIISLQSDIGVSGAEKSALEQQIATLQMGNERQERQAKQEALRLQAEMQSLRQRLDRADADLIHSRRENIRLTEQVATLEKETIKMFQLKMNEVLAEERGRRSIPSPCNGGTTSEIVALPPPKEDRERELSTMIQDIESKHAATVAELEGMIHSQNQLMDKLSDDCHVLTQKLEEANVRHK
ncbi:serologically defined colon cancer antigen 8 [Holotrichia oblita]|uniref:Serologically defined colon cancer antigen 8 n=1 Tax=Holotrichia oblita TaxID=644536 RepID=A0ACB9TZE8_HOLOL|nr:serologically defined colon cancer antigen 8 [Holotrichia oblita]